MAYAIIPEQNLADIADAIRGKNGTSDTYLPSQMAGAISAISTGIEPTGTIQITQNGTVDVAQYASAEVNVQAGDTMKAYLDFKKSCQNMFSNNTTLESVDGMFNFSTTENVTTMQNMFLYCSSLTSVTLFDTSNVTTMQNMFGYCSSLTSVPLFDTSIVTNMSGMLSRCLRLQSVPLFDTSSVTNMNNMLRLDTSSSPVPQYTTLPLFNTTSVTTMSGMLANSRNLQIIPAWDVTACTDFSNMFTNCTSITEIHIINIGASLDISPCTAMSASACLEVMGNLKTVSTTQTLTLPSAVQSGISQSDIDAATAKGWTIAFA